MSRVDKNETTEAREERLAKQRIYSRNHYQENKEHKKIVQDIWKTKNIDKVRETARNYVRNNKEKLSDYYYKTKYGITLEDKNKMIENQKSLCAICNSDNPKSKYGWQVDHDHETNKVRAILCMDCNVTLGLYEKALKDKRFDEYLVKYKCI